jgi:hypothetical protein
MLPMNVRRWHYRVMFDDLEEAPRCTVCGAEMMPEPLTDGKRMAIAYRCPTHGLQLLNADPFDAN